MKTFLVVLSEKCNLNCTYCNVDKWSKDTIDPYLYLAEFKKLRELNPDEEIKIDFFGGEPLLQMDLIKIIIDGVKDDPNVTLSMPTNGLLLTDEIVDFIIEHKIDASVSFDGLWQDRNRLQLNGKSTMQKYLDKRDLFKRLPHFHIHTMIYKGCYNLLENHLFIRDNFGANPGLTLVRDVGTWDHNSVQRLKVGITELFDWYIANPHEEMPAFITFYLRHFLNYQVTKYSKKNCGAGTSTLMFSENKVVPCTRFKDSPEMIEAIPKYAQMPECQSCEVQNYCEKGCLFEQIKNKGPIVELCEIYKYTYKEVSRLTGELRDDPHFKQQLLREIENVN